MLHPVITGLGNLLRNHAQEKNHDSHTEEHGRHVGESMCCYKSITVITQAQEEKDKAYRQKDLQRRKQGGDPDNDKEEAVAVPDDLYFALAHPFMGLDGDKAHGMAAAQERQGGRGGIRETVGEQRKVLQYNGTVEDPKTGSQVLDVEIGHITGQLVVAPVGQPPPDAGLALACPGPNNQVVFFRLGQQSGDILRIMLAVAVHQDHQIAGGASDSGLDRSTVTDIIGVGHHFCPVFFRGADGIVGAAVINHDYFIVRIEAADAGHGAADDLPFVKGRNNNGYFQLFSSSFLFCHQQSPPPAARLLPLTCPSPPFQTLSRFLNLTSLEAGDNEPGFSGS